MAPSAPVVAPLLLLVIAVGRIGAAACEIACLNAPDVPRVVRSTSTTIQPGSGCHESPTAPVDNASRIHARSPHAGCGHEEAAVPFVVAVKFVRGADTPVADHPSSAEPEPVSSITAAPSPAEHAPPGGGAVRVIPLRI